MEKLDSFDLPGLLGASFAGGAQARKAKTGRSGGTTRTGSVSRAWERAVLEGTGELGPLLDLAPSEEAVEKLLDAVRGAGDDLKNRPFPPEILAFKQAVRNFVHYVLENGLSREDQVGIPNAAKPGYHGRLRDPAAKERKTYQTVRVVDQKLEELAVSILSGQSTQMERIAQLDEITGLLVDLTVTGAIAAR